MKRVALLGALAAALAGCGAEGGSAMDLSDGPRTAPEVRPDTPGGGLQFAFDPGDVVETYGSNDGRFLVHFTRLGPNAVPDDDDDATGVPDFVEEVAAVYVDVLAAYLQLGFRAPLDDGAIADNGGDDRFDVYLVDFAGVGDGAFRTDACGGSDVCAGFMTQENDYVGYGYPSTLVANRILGSHEFFHAVQAAYDVDQGSILAEGTAVWATETFDPSLHDFEAFLDGYLDNPDRPLDSPLPGPVDPFSYGSAIFFQFLEERFGPGMVLAILEGTEDGAGGVPDPQWFPALDATLQAAASTSFEDAFVEFATWNLYTTNAFADPAASYASGAGYPRVHLEGVTVPHQDDALRVYYASAQYFRADPAGRAAMTAALVPPMDDPTAADGLRLLFATESAIGITVAPEVADPTAGVETVDTSGADRLVVFVVNGALEGESKKPGLCIGTVAEITACKMALANGGAGGAGGGGGAGAGGAGGAGGSGDAATTSSSGGPQPGGETEGGDGGCGCRVPSSSSSNAGALASAIAIAIGLQRRRRRETLRRPSASPTSAPQA